METQQDRLKEVLNELFTLLEAQETNSAAVLQLLKDEGIASDEKLATYVDQAGNASSVKWRAARMRMEYLLTSAQKQTSDNDKAKEAPKDTEPDKGNDKDKEQEQSSTKSLEAESSETKSSEAKSSESKSDDRNAEKTATSSRSESKDTPPNENKTASVKSA
jgi:hypothetical protein